MAALVSGAQAAQVTLAWDANSTPPDGYRLFQRAAGGVYNYSSPTWSGSGTSATLSNLADGATYYFVVRAFASSNESGDSNEVSYLTPIPTPQTYTITASAGANGAISPSGSNTITAGANSTFSITAATGYHVADVLVDGTSVGAVSSYTFSSVSANHTISASFAINSFTITSSAGSNGSISPSGSRSVNYGGSQAYTITAATGYHVASVLVDGTSVGAISSYTFSNVTANHTISASFAINTFTINSSAGSNGSISPSGSRSVNYGGSQAYTITAATGYHVASVLVDGASVGAVSGYTFSNVSANHTISASFAINTYTITSSAGANGSISPSGTTSVNHGGSQAYTITAAAGYYVAGVLVDGASVGAVSSYTFSNVSANHTIAASFQGNNQAPTADAGPDQTVDEGLQVALNGLNSTDPDDGIASYSWAQVQGPTVTIASANTAQAYFTAPNVDQLGEALEFELTVTDRSGASAKDRCIVNVTWVNTPPTALTSGNQTVASGALVVLDGTPSSDPDGGALYYRWIQSQGPAVTLSDSSAAQPQFTAPSVGVQGASLVFNLTVTDEGGLQATASCIVTVTHVNQPPVASAGPDQTVMESDLVTLDGSASLDSDDGIRGYLWKQTEGTPVTLSDSTAIKPTFIAPAVGTDGAILRFQLTVTDNSGLQGSANCQVSIRDSAPAPTDTTPPTVTITSPARSQVSTKNSKITIKGIASDDTLLDRVVWANVYGDSGVTTGTSSWQIANLRLRRGYNTITVTAYDAAGNSSTDTVVVYASFRR